MKHLNCCISTTYLMTLRNFYSFFRLNGFMIILKILFRSNIEIFMD